MFDSRCAVLRCQVRCTNLLSPHSSELWLLQRRYQGSSGAAKNLTSCNDYLDSLTSPLAQSATQFPPSQTPQPPTLAASLDQPITEADMEAAQRLPSERVQIGRSLLGYTLELLPYAWLAPTDRSQPQCTFWHRVVGALQCSLPDPVHGVAAGLPCLASSLMGCINSWRLRPLGPASRSSLCV